MFDYYYLSICSEMIEVLTSYADHLPMKIQGSSECQTVAPSIHLLLSAHSTDLALCWTTSKQSEGFSVSWWCQMILYTSPYKSIPTADVWYSSWLHIQEKPLVFYIIHIVSHWAVCRLCRLHLDHLNFAWSVVSFTGVQAAPDLVFNMTTKLAWLANVVAGECCNVPLVISNLLGWKSGFCQVHALQAHPNKLIQGMLTWKNPPTRACSLLHNWLLWVSQWPNWLSNCKLQPITYELHFASDPPVSTRYHLGLSLAQRYCSPLLCGWTISWPFPYMDEKEHFKPVMSDNRLQQPSHWK